MGLTDNVGVTRAPGDADGEQNLTSSPPPLRIATEAEKLSGDITPHPYDTLSEGLRPTPTSTVEEAGNHATQKYPQDACLSPLYVEPYDIASENTTASPCKEAHPSARNGSLVPSLVEVSSPMSSIGSGMNTRKRKTVNGGSPSPGNGRKLKLVGKGQPVMTKFFKPRKC